MGDGDLRGPAVIAADDGVGRVVAVHGQTDETDRGEAPVALGVLSQPQVSGLSAVAAAKREDLVRVEGHGSDSKPVQGEDRPAVVV